jgi:hypothetical protein
MSLRKPIELNVLMTLILSLLILTAFSCGRSNSPVEHAWDMEANHPWIVFNPTMEQGLAAPYADKLDPNIMYLIFVQENGSAIKFDLKTKSSFTVKFRTDKGDPERTLRYQQGFKNMNRDATMWEEFRGQIESREITHVYGFPYPNQPGTRKAEFRTGYWYIMDEQNGRKVELLRVRVQNSELTGGGGLGYMSLSPDKKWAVFRLANFSSRIYVFNRETIGPETFQ